MKLRNYIARCTILFLLTTVISGYNLPLINLFGLNNSTVQAGTDPANLVTNPSFESGLTGWIHSIGPSATGSASVETANCTEGQCAKLQLTAPVQWQALYRSIGSLTPGILYKVSARFKTSTGHAASISLYDSSWKNSGGTVVGRSNTSQHQGNGAWQTITRYVMIPAKDAYNESTATHVWQIYLYGMYPATNLDPLYYDDVEVIPQLTDPRLVPAYGCINNATAKCLDLGGDEAAGSVTYTPSSAFDVPATDGSITYRSLKATQTVEISVPAFNVDAQGFPLSPMLLEVGYKDTIDSGAINQIGAEMVTNRRMFIDSKINFSSDDPSFNSWSDKTYFPLIGVGDYNDAAWKYTQISIGLTPFQTIRAVNGSFTFRLRMPNTVAQDSSLSLPLNYFALRAISDSEYQSSVTAQRSAMGFYSISPAPDEPSPAISYTDTDLVTFSRDLMQPIYSYTKPAAAEVGIPLSSFSARGETEPFSLGLYSPSGISNLSAEVSNLTTHDSQTIPSTNIRLQQVIYREVNLNQTYSYDRSSSNFPDYLKDATTFDIPAGTSQRLVITVEVPDNAAGGLYMGTVTIKENGTSKKTVAIRLEVLPITLTASQNMNNLYHDPWYKVYGSNQNNVLKVFRQAGITPFLHPRTDGNMALSMSGSNVADIDLTGFSLKLDKMISEKLIHTGDKVFIETVYLWLSIYSSIFSSWAGGDTNLYSNLSDSRYVAAITLLVNKLNTLAQQRGLQFVYGVVDEPGSDPYLRIASDRNYTILKNLGQLTTLTYSNACESGVSTGAYTAPGGTVGALTNLIDYKVWIENDMYSGFNKGYSNYGYYTTNTSQMRDPIYDRFLQGFFAYRTQAKTVSAYAMGDLVGSPYDDFDAEPSYVFPFTYPDFLLGYPAWDGSFYPTMSVEGLREGAKDGRYIATLKQLITDHPGTVATEAQAYLNSLSSRINPDYMNTYANARTSTGYTAAILHSVSPTSDSQDYSAFSTVRKQIKQYIATLAGITTPGTVVLSKQVSISEATLGNKLTYTITYQNVGGSPATNVRISDSVPLGTMLDSTPAGATLTGSLLTWDIGTLPAYSDPQSVSFEVTIQ